MKQVQKLSNFRYSALKSGNQIGKLVRNAAALSLRKYGVKPFSSKELIEMESKYSCHNYIPLPVVFKEASGIYVKDPEGKQYIDFLSCYSAVNQGHCHPVIIEALVKQAKAVTLSSRAFYNNQFPLWAKYVTEYFHYESVLPANSGVEAVEAALKLARKWGYKKKKIPENNAIIISCKDNFHGRTLGVISMSTDPVATTDFGPFLEGLEGYQIPFNDTEALEHMLESYGDRVAAFLVEPVQGEAGVIVPDVGYLRKVQDSCRKHNVLLIADEVQSGLGRTGKMLASDHDEGVRPDIVILGKALSGGVLPVSCILSDWNIMEVIGPGEHGSTYGGNPLACAVSMAALRVLKEEGMVENSEKMGRLLKDELLSLLKTGQQDGAGIVKAVRGRGLFCAIDVDQSHPKMANGNAFEICKLLLDKGLLAKPTHDNTIRLAPPLIMREKELLASTDIIKSVIHQVEKNG